MNIRILVAALLVIAAAAACTPAKAGALDGPCNVEQPNCNTGLTCLSFQDCHGEVARPLGCDSYCADCAAPATSQETTDCQLAQSATGEGEGEGASGQ
jgi:hypothetical protein